MQFKCTPKNLSQFNLQEYQLAQLSYVKSVDKRAWAILGKRLNQPPLVVLRAKKTDLLSTSFKFLDLSSGETFYTQRGCGLIPGYNSGLKGQKILKTGLLSLDTDLGTFSLTEGEAEQFELWKFMISPKLSSYLDS